VPLRISGKLKLEKNDLSPLRLVAIRIAVQLNLIACGESTELLCRVDLIAREIVHGAHQ